MCWIHGLFQRLKYLVWYIGSFSQVSRFNNSSLKRMVFACALWYCACGRTISSTLRLVHKLSSMCFNRLAWIKLLIAIRCHTHVKHGDIVTFGPYTSLLKNATMLVSSNLAMPNISFKCITLSAFLITDYSVLYWIIISSLTFCLYLYLSSCKYVLIGIYDIGGPYRITSLSGIKKKLSACLFCWVSYSGVLKSCNETLTLGALGRLQMYKTNGI